ncbi:MAG TPA: fructosamine kinase family protein [Nitrosospira sp.]
MPPWAEIAAQISASTGSPFAVEAISSIGGGCINQAQRIEGKGRQFFVKLNGPESLAMFEAEAAGLQEIRDSGTLHAPEPVCWGKSRSRAWLVLEYLEMGKVSTRGAEALGAGLAAMHRCTSVKFGWRRDNTIGATPQINTRTSGWVQFWREHRLGYQLQLAQANGHTGKLRILGEKLLATLDSFFLGPEPAASLLHGDLWSGNYGFDREAQPILFDPAVYYGDRETDIAMTELFGGFPAAFYAAYRESYPLDPGYDVRKNLYNLYHVLNHLNLFGGGYRHQAEQMMGRLLDET